MKKNPLTKQIIALVIVGHELIIKNLKRKHCIKPIMKPITGENCAMFLNFGLMNGSLGNIV